MKGDKGPLFLISLLGYRKFRNGPERLFKNLKCSTLQVLMIIISRVGIEVHHFKNNKNPNILLLKIFLKWLIRSYQTR